MRTVPTLLALLLVATSCRDADPPPPPAPTAPAPAQATAPPAATAPSEPALPGEVVEIPVRRKSELPKSGAGSIRGTCPGNPCPPGQECVLVEVHCIRAPCPPMPECVLPG